MKRIIMTVFFAVAFVCIMSSAQIYAKEYNVRLSSGLLSADQPPSQSWITADESELLQLIAMGNVEYYEEDHLAELLDYPENDALYGLMWEHPMIGSEKAWESGAFGAGVTVAVIDSGASSHPELKNRIAYTKNYLSGTADVTDNIGHGTKVAGVIAANRGNGIGFTGVAPRCKLAILKVADKVSGKQKGPYISDVSRAIEDAVDLYGCRVINLSLGTTTESARLKEAVDYAVSKGAVIVAASGNDSGKEIRYPAMYDNVLGVGAVDKNGKWAEFSNFNSGVDVSAPGKSACLIHDKSSYVYSEGTSFSSPYVAGVCAAMISADPDIKNDKVMQIIKDTAKDDAANDGYDFYYGHGIVDFAACVEEVIKGSGIYISQIDTEDDEKKVYVTNTGLPGERFVLVAEHKDGLVSYHAFGAQAGLAASVSLESIDVSTVKNLFAVADIAYPYSISEYAGRGLSYTLAEDVSVGGLNLFVTDVNENTMSAAIEKSPVDEGEKCNITVDIITDEGTERVYFSELYGEKDTVECLFDSCASELSGYARQGVVFEMTFWENSTSHSLRFTFAKAGDADKNGFVEVDDIVILRKLLAGLAPKDAYDFYDVDCDGSFSPDDLAELRKIVAGLK